MTHAFSKTLTDPPNDVGTFLSTEMGIGKSKQQANVVCVGLDFAGKSTIINFLKPENQKVDDLQPTVGLSTESFKYGKIAFTVQDMSGARQYRSLWKENIDSTDGVLFVIDSADSLRLVIAKDELAEIVGASILPLVRSPPCAFGPDAMRACSGVSLT